MINLNQAHIRQYFLFYIMVLFSLTPWINSPTALIMGLILASFNKVPTHFRLTSITKKLLTYSIVGLGFGIHINEAIEATTQGLGMILATIVGTLSFGWLFAKWIKLDKKTGHLIASGTAICGGSAIAAVAPAIDADDQSTGLALATVFILNSIALLLFPLIGHGLGLTQSQFGTWAAIAIHDTSSVVGAASAYGEEALKTATTLKLARALWIIPIAFISALLFRNSSKKIAIPYFIVFYCFAILISDALPQFSAIYEGLFHIAKKALVLCLFFIGCNLSLAKIKQSGTKPMLYGTVLWCLISGLSLFWILH